MGKDELTPEELFLKEGELSPGPPPVDVHDSVMEAVGLGHSRIAADSAPHPQKRDTPDTMHKMEAGHRRKRTLGKRARRWAAALLLLALAGGGYSLVYEGPGQAALFQYEVLPYEPLVATEEGGEIELSPPLVHSENPVTGVQMSEEEQLLNDKYSEAYRTIEKLLLPGEAASYVLRKEDGGDELARIGAVYPAVQFHDYSGYLAEARQYAAPELPQPEYMPDGYVFDQAWIELAFEMKENEVLALTGGIPLEGGYRLAWRKEPRDSIHYNLSALTYNNGGSVLRMNAKRLSAGTGTVERLLRTQTTKVESILVNGTQLIYMETANGEEMLDYKYRLVWADPEQNILYDLTVSRGSSLLTKEEVIRIAAGMMPQP